MQIVLKPSRLLVVTLIAGHGLAAGAAVLCGLPLGLEAAMVAVIAMNLALSLHALHKSDVAIVAVEFSDGGAFNIRNRRGDWIECSVLGDTYVSPFLTVLNARQIESRRGEQVTIWPDVVPPEEFRALRVWLRWKARPNAQPHPGEWGGA